MHPNIWETGAGFMDQTKFKVKQNHYNTRFLLAIYWKVPPLEKFVSVSQWKTISKSEFSAGMVNSHEEIRFLFVSRS